MDPPAARFEVEVDPQPPETRSLRMYVLLGAGAFASLLSPRSFGVPFALPLLFAWLGTRVASARPRDPYRVTIFEDTVVVRTPFCVASTPLAHLRRVVESADALALALPSGDVSIPLAALGGDRRRLLDALPAHVAHELEPAPAKASPSGGKVLALWVVLILIFLAIYNVMGAR